MLIHLKIYVARDITELPIHEYSLQSILVYNYHVHTSALYPSIHQLKYCVLGILQERAQNMGLESDPSLSSDSNPSRWVNLKVHNHSESLFFHSQPEEITKVKFCNLFVCGINEPNLQYKNMQRCNNVILRFKICVFKMSQVKTISAHVQVSTCLWLSCTQSWFTRKSLALPEAYF